MSRLDELIAELCPDGVEYLSLEKVTSAINIRINPRKIFKLNPDDATGFYVTVRKLNGLQGVKQFVEVFAKREEVEHFAHLASYEEVSGNDYNLSVSTYVEAEDTREKIDIVKLNAEIKEIVAREQVLRDEIDKIIAEIEV